MNRQPLKRRTPLRRVGTKRARENREYAKERDAFLAENQKCAAHNEAGITCQGELQLHHYRGRRGRLLRMEAFWLSICAAHHSFIHDYPNMARELGLLAPVTEFDVVPEIGWEDRPR